MKRRASFTRPGGAARTGNVWYVSHSAGDEMFRAFSDPYACEIDETAPNYTWRVILQAEPNCNLASGTGTSMEESVKSACVAMAMLKKRSKPLPTFTAAR